MDGSSRAAARDAARVAGLAAAVTANVVAGASYVLTKTALAGLGAHELVALRTLVGLACLLPLVGWQPVVGLLRTPGRPRALLLAMGLLGYALPITVGNYGLRTATATHGAMLIGLEPIGIAVLSALLLGERLGVLRIAALGLGLAGAALVVGGEWRPTGPATWGDVLLAAHAALWALYTIAGKPLVQRFDATAVTTAGLVVALPPLLLVAGAEWAWVPRPGGALLPAVAAAVALGVLLSALMTVLWNAALRRMEASELAGFVFLQPLTGAALGVGLLGEPLGAAAVAGGGLVLAGVLLLAHEVRSAPPAC